MTNKEARKVLQEVWRNERTDYGSVEVKEAIDRAIKTLGEKPQDEWYITPDRQITIEEYMQSLKGEKNERRR